MYRGLVRWLFAAAVVVTLAGCGGPGSNLGEVDPDDPVVVDPESGDEAPPPDDGGSDEPALHLANLPIGGGVVDSADPAVQCVEVNWLGQEDAADIPASVHIGVTQIDFTPAIFDLGEGGCSSSLPPCTDYVYGADARACLLVIRPNGEPFDPDGARPVVALQADIACDDPASAECSDFEESIQDETQSQFSQIELEFPPTDTGDTEPDTDG